MITGSAVAKINLGLQVLRKRSDGYHDIETFFLPILWYDRVSVAGRKEITFSCSDPALPVDDTNLCVKAAHLLKAASGAKTGAHIHLEKSISYGAGLGGGSSDAAQTLLLLSTLWGIELATEELQDIAAKIGSDVPFFIQVNAALGTGTGTVLHPVPYQLPYHLLVVVPRIHVSTAEAYGGVKPWDVDRPSILEAVLSNDLQRWRKELVNDFEASVFELYPEIGRLKSSLYDLGAGYSAMSGSGSAVFGVFESDFAFRKAVDFAKDNQFRYCAIRKT